MARINGHVIELSPWELAACIVAPLAAGLVVLALCLLFCLRRQRLNWYDRSLLQEDLRRIKGSADSSTEKSFLCEASLSKRSRGSGSRDTTTLPAITIGCGDTGTVIRSYRRQDTGSSMGSGSSSPEEAEPSPTAPSAEDKTGRRSSSSPRGADRDSAGAGYRTFTSASTAANQSVPPSQRKDSLSPLPSISSRRKDSGSISGGSMDAGRRDSGDMLIPSTGANKKRTQSLTPGMGMLHSSFDQGKGHIELYLIPNFSSSS